MSKPLRTRFIIAKILVLVITGLRCLHAVITKKNQYFYLTHEWGKIKYILQLKQRGGIYILGVGFTY